MKTPRFWAKKAPAAPALPPPSPLADLLRRCHRDELDPLIAALGYNAAGLGLGQLASGLDAALRRSGGHVLGNLLLRRGEGPSYPKVLRALAKRVGVPKTQRKGDEEALEGAILSALVARGWKDSPDAVRAEAWALLGGSGAAPASGQTAVDAVRKKLGKSYNYKVAALAASGAATRVLPLLVAPISPVGFLGLAMWWMGRPRLERLVPSVLAVARLRQVVRHRLTIGVVGSPSSGKDAALQAIFGVKTGNIHPVAGSTREVSITRIPGATALHVVNTPGLGDVVEAVTEEARQVLDHIDIYLVIVSAQGGVQTRERETWQAVAATGRPALVVVNKIDTLRPEDRARFLADCREKLGVGERALLGVAFDPLPQLAEHPLGVDEVRAWLVEQLVALGKDPGELPALPTPPDGAGP